MDRIRLKDKEFELFIPESDIQAAIAKMAVQIKADVEGKNPLFVGVLNGAFMFVAELMVILNGLLSEPPLLVAGTVKLDVPSEVGVPEIRPVLSFKVKPVGREPLVTLHVIGAVPVAVSVWLYDVPSVPFGRLSVVMEGA